MLRRPCEVDVLVVKEDVRVEDLEDPRLLYATKEESIVDPNAPAAQRVDRPLVGRRASSGYQRDPQTGHIRRLLQPLAFLKLLDAVQVFEQRLEESRLDRVVPVARLIHHIFGDTVRPVDALRGIVRENAVEVE